MTPKHETKFQYRLNRRLPVEVHAEKMNNPYRGGTADYWYSGYKADLWVEYKWFKAAPIRSAKVGLQRLQELWLNDALRKGRNVCVIIGSPQGCAILLDGAWMHNVTHGQFNHTELAVSRWIIGRVHVVPKENTSSSEDSMPNHNNVDPSI